MNHDDAKILRGRSPHPKINDPNPVVAIKHDQDKLPWDLLPWDAVSAAVQVLAFGARKYSVRNWEHGFVWSRCYAAVIRHLTAWWHREDKDPETGYSHLAHAMCMLMFLLAFEIRGSGEDDRPYISEPRSKD